MIHTEMLACPPTGLVSLERTRFFPRQLVAPDDLTQDQIYFRDKLRRHNRLLHGWGIVCGARVRKGPGACDAVVEPGYILGPYGDEILIDREVTADLCREGAEGNATCAGAVDPWCSDVRVERTTGRDYYLAVRYAECEARPVRVASTACGCEPTECEYSRIRDGYALKLLTELPSSYRITPAAAPAPSDTVQERCIGFDTRGSEPGPTRVVDGVRFTLEDSDPTETVVTRDGGFTGLLWRMGMALIIELPAPSARVRMTVRHPYASPLGVQALDASGNVVADYEHQATHPEPDAVELTAPAIKTIHVESKHGGQLLEFCFEARTTVPAARPCPPCPAEPWVILATARFKADGTLDTLDCTQYRRYVVSLAGMESFGGAAPAVPGVGGGGAAGGGAATGGAPGGGGAVAGRLTPWATRRAARAGLDERAVRRIEAEHGGDLTAARRFPASAIKGVGTRSALGRALADTTVEEVAAMSRDAFIAEMRRRAPDARPVELEKQAAEAWRRATEVTRVR